MSRKDDLRERLLDLLDEFGWGGSAPHDGMIELLTACEEIACARCWSWETILELAHFQTQQQLRKRNGADQS